MNIRNAILKAADSIETHRNLYEFCSTRIPDPDCGTPGCALGWIGFHLGIPKRETLGHGLTQNNHSVYDALGIDSQCCFDHLRQTVGHGKWKFQAIECAKALRQYADIHHPITDHIPSSVRAIFEVETIDA